MIDRRLFTNIDWTLMILVLLLGCIGIANIYSATAPYRIIGAPYYLKQFYWLAFGFLLVILVSAIDYHLLEDISYWLYGILILLLVTVLVAGYSSMGATRWLHLGFIKIAAVRVDENRNNSHIREIFQQIRGFRRDDRCESAVSSCDSCCSGNSGNEAA